MPITTDDQIPTSGETPTMVEHAMAFDSSENATVRPASDSLTILLLGFVVLLFEVIVEPPAAAAAAIGVSGGAFVYCEFHRNDDFLPTVVADVVDNDTALRP